MSSGRTAQLRMAVVMALCAAALTSCAGGALGQGRSPGYIVIDALTAASGADPTKFGGTLDSDVLTMVKQQVNGQQVSVPTVFGDLGQVAMHLNLKDVGSAASPTAPTANNEITINQYHVSYARSDGLNTPGVDVPYAFDGAITATISGSQAVTFSFDIVRVQAKEEAPLAALRNGGGAHAISTIATVTFYGQDQTGHQVSVSGTISVNFGDWADPSR
ncbi:MAG TPA: hypothetical protein VIC33_02300 [Vicinamibacterales bacterium]